MAALISLSDYKVYAGVQGTALDAQLTALINLASSVIRNLCGRSDVNGFESATRTELVSGSASNTIAVREWPITSITSISFVDSNGGKTLLDANGYRAVANGYGTIELVNSVSSRYGVQIGYEFDVNRFGYQPQWLRGVNNYEVIYVGGYATIPLALQMVCMQAVGILQASAGTKAAFASENIGDYSYTKGEKAPGGPIASIAAMLGPWRVGA